ncbi:MAG TPA: type II toxin-antitoxin system RelE/ParE family toxin [Thermoanaerobaculia bacterium]|nr:type II toxin-antitoxin system RelE/ParE family toxin [Thermoanaerobaculia bacterium]
MYHRVVIVSFGDAATEDVYNGESSGRTRRFGPEVQKAAIRKLDMLNAAHSLEDLKMPPGNRLEALKGSLSGCHSIRVNDQWRLVFRWNEGFARDVRLIDYH